MGIYRDHLLPQLQDKVMSRRGIAAARSRVCGGTEGAVVEVGFGSGLNLAHYPPEVTEVYVVEPSRVCLRIAERRIAASRTRVEVAGVSAEQIDLPSGQFDHVVSTWTLCTIPDVTAALDEMLRLLRPGGAFHFIEHGLAPDPKVATWQRRIEPLNKRLAGGCHLTRSIPDLIEGAGFAGERLDTYYFKGDPKPFGYTFEGRARRP